MQGWFLVLQSQHAGKGPFTGWTDHSPLSYSIWLCCAGYFYVRTLHAIAGHKKRCFMIGVHNKSWATFIKTFKAGTLCDTLRRVPDFGRTLFMHCSWLGRLARYDVRTNQETLDPVWCSFCAYRTVKVSMHRAWSLSLLSFWSNKNSTFLCVLEMQMERKFTDWLYKPESSTSGGIKLPATSAQHRWPIFSASII